MRSAGCSPTAPPARQAGQKGQRKNETCFQIQNGVLRAFKPARRSNVRTWRAISLPKGSV
eukprot:6184367-Pleurochrysis_carterae.AAC.1